MAKKERTRELETHIQAFEYEGDELQVTPDMKKSFDRDGVIVVKKLFSSEEIARIIESLEGSDALKNAWDLSDGEGRFSRLLLWNQPGNDVSGMVARCEKMVTTCEKLLEKEVYHFHTKLMRKEARFGGKHLWHQDYGYWYKNGCLLPDMMTVFVPLDKCTKENGCLQVVPGTNRCGRIDHDLVAGQTMANQQRVDMLLERFPLVYAEADPGDAIFFHCNLLHRSDKNGSDFRRWAFLVAYNTRYNDPDFRNRHISYKPLKKVANDAVLACETLCDFSGKDIMDPSKDKTVRIDFAKSK